MLPKPNEKKAPAARLIGGWGTKEVPSSPDTRMRSKPNMLSQRSQSSEHVATDKVVLQAVSERAPAVASERSGQLQTLSTDFSEPLVSCSTVDDEGASAAWEQAAPAVNAPPCRDMGTITESPTESAHGPLVTLSMAEYRAMQFKRDSTVALEVATERSTLDQPLSRIILILTDA